MLVICQNKVEARFTRFALFFNCIFEAKVIEGWERQGVGGWEWYLGKPEKQGLSNSASQRAGTRVAGTQANTPKC